MQIFVAITSYKEEFSIGKAVEQIICPNRDLWPQFHLFITSPDASTLKKAEEVCQKYNFTNFELLTDLGEGKAVALNIAVAAVTNKYVINYDEDLLIMTDGDMYISDGAIKMLLNPFIYDKGRLGGIGGHPVSLDGRDTMFGYFSHLFCEAAHNRRLADSSTPMSGYLYAIKHWDKIFPIPGELRAEDAYISKKLLEFGYRIAYVPEALAYVKFPKNAGDWFKQKTRSLGGNVQVSRSLRSVVQDLNMALFPLVYAKSPKEFIWSLMLYPLRMILWLRIYFNHIFNRYSTGMWERVESTK